MALRTIIDESGLPDAGGYYAFFPREPSPAGNLTLTPATTSRIQGISLLAILGEMLQAGSGGEVLLVCHGEPDGLIVHLAPGATTASADALNVLMGADDAEERAAAIRKLPEKTKEEISSKRDKMVELVNSLQTGALMGQVTLQQASDKFDEFFASEGKRLKVNAKVLLSLCVARRRVVALQLARLEVRACNAGDTRKTLLAFKKFFGCKKVLAPKFETFFVSPVTIQVIESGRFTAGIAVFGRIGVSLRNPALEDVFAVTPNAAIRTQRERMRVPGPARTLPTLPRMSAGLASAEREIMQNGSLRSFGAFVGVALWETPRFQYKALIVTKIPFWVKRTGAITAITAPDWPTIQTFVKKFIMPTSSYTQGRFPIAGFANTNLDEKPYLFANEEEYVAAIVSFQ